MAAFLLPRGYSNLKPGEANRLNTPSIATPSSSEAHVYHFTGAVATLLSNASSRAFSSGFTASGLDEDAAGII